AGASRRAAASRSGRGRGRPTLPRTGGTRSTNGRSWVTSLRLPPVTVQASGIPVASTRRGCLEPFLALSTGLGPVAEPPFSLADDWSPRPPATTPARLRRATRPAALRAAAPRRPPAATRPSAGNRSNRRQSRARAADAATRSPCTAQTGSLAGPAGQAAAYDPDSESAAPPSEAAARSATTTHPTQPTAQQSSAPLSA